jgi:hypothetical protein
MRSVPVLLLALPLAAGCAAAPAGPPDQVAARIVVDLDRGESDDARELWKGVAARPEHRERIYPILYQAARERYSRGDVAGSSRILRFMEPRYPDALAVRQALLYSLFVERALMEAPDPKLVAAIEEGLADVREGSAQLPAWVDLVATQTAIDQNRLSEARESFGRFRSQWQGEPQELALYVEDLERYLTSH